MLFKNGRECLRDAKKHDKHEKDVNLFGRKKRINLILGFLKGAHMRNKSVSSTRYLMHHLQIKAGCVGEIDRVQPGVITRFLVKSTVE